mgnify:CR=1 FL=1
MMEIIDHLGLGFSVALTLKNIGLCFVGCLFGTLVGVLPSVGPVATISILLPVTLALDPTGALIMLAGIYYGAQYGGSTTAILVNIPGEATAVVTAIDGHEIAKRGQAGLALGLAAVGSFIAGTVATIVIAALGVPMTRLGLLFGPDKYFSLMVMSLVLAVMLAHGSVLKAIAMLLVRRNASRGRCCWASSSARCSRRTCAGPCSSPRAIRRSSSSARSAWSCCWQPWFCWR